MILKQHGVGVYEIENFLTEDEINGLLLSKNDDGFVKSHPGNIVKTFVAESASFIPAISDRLMSLFDNAHHHSKITNLRRLKEGEFMYSHRDNGYLDSKEIIVFGIAIYLNDDFTGGELSYPDIELSVKPKRSSIVIHDARLLHKVLPVKSGVRYSITTFIFGDKTTTIRL